MTFEYKDYADESRKKLLTMNAEEFLRRFRLHLLPARFVKIQHYGLLSNRNRHDRVATARAALNVALLPKTSPDTAATPEVSSHIGQACPHCQQPALRLIRVLRPSATGARTKITDTS